MKITIENNWFEKKQLAKKMYFKFASEDKRKFYERLQK